MELYVGNLPPGVDSGHLCKALRHAALLPLWMIRSAEVVEFHDRHGYIGRYGRIILTSRSIGRYVVRRLMGNPVLHGYRMVVREFHYRAAGNERRALNWRLRYWGSTERRRSERRVFSERALTSPSAETGPHRKRQMVE